jgi:polyhydroxybutyrate depolymerase
VRGRPLVSVTFALGFAVVAAGCSGGDGAAEIPATTTSVVTTTSAPAAPTDATFAPAGYESLVTSDGRTRSYRVVDLSGGAPAPLLFVLHGFGGSAEDMRSYTGVEEAVRSSLADGAVVAYPNGTGLEEGLPQSWNAGDCCPFSTYDMVDDVAFFDQLINVITSAYDIDTSRIWVVGHSNGGMMAYRLACELSERITAIGVAAGALMTDPCTPDRPVAAMHLHGELDAVVPLAGGETAGITFPSARDSFDRFATANSCTLLDSTASCPGGATMVLRVDAGWTHDWQADWTSLLLGFLDGQVRG